MFTPAMTSCAVFVAATLSAATLPLAVLVVVDRLDRRVGGKPVIIGIQDPTAGDIDTPIRIIDGQASATSMTTSR